MNDDGLKMAANMAQLARGKVACICFANLLK